MVQHSPFSCWVHQKRHFFTALGGACRRRRYLWALKVLTYLQYEAVIFRWRVATLFRKSKGGERGGVRGLSGGSWSYPSPNVPEVLLSVGTFSLCLNLTCDLFPKPNHVLFLPFFGGRRLTSGVRLVWRRGRTAKRQYVTRWDENNSPSNYKSARFIEPNLHVDTTIN